MQNKLRQPSKTIGQTERTLEDKNRKKKKGKKKRQKNNDGINKISLRKEIL